ncbi:MAG: bifunctional diaminohydroxyphosphoribosylaminopyrimidine deaminase/5-amino-6-(5-phosphoribosylamino)uracil reductase RibD [Nocardioidaceae bacterium]
MTQPDAMTAAMQRALDVAATPGFALRGNPRVGCVLLDPHGAVIAEGFHRGAGTTHAEVDALAKAGERARGATAVVTLEPCNHTGRTGACAQALIAAGVTKVVYAQRDPNPQAAGGATTLAAASVTVEAGLLADQAEALNHEWTIAVSRGRPYVLWKYAATLDGRSAAADGSSRWVTGSAARRDVHGLRAAHDAIVVGTGTVRADNPSLTARDLDDKPLPPDQQPTRVVVGHRHLRDGLAVADDAAPTVFVDSHDPTDVLADLWGLGLVRVFLEGGPTVAAAWLRAGVIDEIVAYVAPAMLGAGAPAVGDLGIHTIAEALRFRTESVQRLGNDVKIVLATGSALGEGR